MRNLMKCIACFLLLVLFHISCGKSNVEIETEETVVSRPDIELATVSHPVFEDITTASAKVQAQVLHKGGGLVTNRGICWSLSPNPTIENNSLDANSVNGAGFFSVQLVDLIHNTNYYVKAWAENLGGISYSEEVIFKTAAVQLIVFKESPMFIIGATVAAYDAEIESNGGGEISERGICWGRLPNPTVDNERVKKQEGGVGKYRLLLTELDEQTDYYLRAYAINEQGVSYGENVAFRTIAKGNVTYTFNKVSNPTPEELEVYDRLEKAIDSAIWYVNNYTSATKHVWLNYDIHVPTADANNEGWMRFGANSGFHNIRTMLHELNHTFGTGTTSWWWNQAIAEGKYQLPNANNILRLITNDNSAVLSGDNQHWWPYGLNQNSEVTSSWDFVYNCLLIEAMRKDGMVSHSGVYNP